MVKNKLCFKVFRRYVYLKFNSGREPSSLRLFYPISSKNRPLRQPFDCRRSLVTGRNYFFWGVRSVCFGVSMALPKRLTSPGFSNAAPALLLRRRLEIFSQSSGRRFALSHCASGYNQVSAEVITCRCSFSFR